jgi:putative transposase
LKKERIKKRIYADRESALLDVTEYIEAFYNPKRRQSYLGGVSPNEFEAVHRQRRSGVN